MRSCRVLLCVVVGWLAAPGVAAAATVTWSGAITPSDPVAEALTVSIPPSTCSSIAPVRFEERLHHDAYALRNLGGDDCVTVSLQAGPCGVPLTASVYLGAFDPLSPDDDLIGGDASASCGFPFADTIQAAVPAGRTFIPVVRGFAGPPPTSTAYTLTVSGSSPYALADQVTVRGELPRGNALQVEASVLADGTAPEGTVRVEAADGQYFAGPVDCLRVEGDKASLLMRITDSNGPARFKGAVFWLEEVNSGTGKQRNTRLTQAQLDAYGGACPDPSAPLGGATRALDSGYVSVIDTPAPDSGP